MIAKAFFSFLLVSCFVLGETPVIAEGDKPLPTVHGLAIPNEDIPAFEEKALDGDPEAARRLATFYMIRGQDAPAVYWFTIAAENGSIIGQYNLGFALRNDPDPKNRRRAVYWLKRVAQSDDKGSAKMATSLLEEISGK
ncbi:MAG TPA: hypothetical protein VN328_11955 [Thermodesulfovibrionales bacterium]|nr:hypothetical protein [Thermodesulfovibrionales bacterium]